MVVIKGRRPEAVEEDSDSESEEEDDAATTDRVSSVSGSEYGGSSYVSTEKVSSKPTLRLSCLVAVSRDRSPSPQHKLRQNL